MDGDGGLGLQIFGVIDPGRTGCFLFDFGRLKGSRRVAGAFETFWPFHAEAETPSGFASLRDEKDWIVARLGNRRADWRFALGSLRLRGLRLDHGRRSLGKNTGRGQADRCNGKNRWQSASV